MDSDAPDGGVDDMTKLAYLHEPGVLHNLSLRYQLDEIYVSTEEDDVILLFTMPGHGNRQESLYIEVPRRAGALHCVRAASGSSPEPWRAVATPLFTKPAPLSFRPLCTLQTYTGKILIAVNPFQKISHLYGTHMMEQYRGMRLGELSPHVFAIAESAYR